jgi:hypothetical protein
VVASSQLPDGLIMLIKNGCVSMPMSIPRICYTSVRSTSNDSLRTTYYDRPQSKTGHARPSILPSGNSLPKWRNSHIPTRSNRRCHERCTVQVDEVQAAVQLCLVRRRRVPGTSILFPHLRSLELLCSIVAVRGLALI